MLSSGLGVVGFSWAASPACTELETIVLHWLGKMYGLPKTLLPFEDILTEEVLTEKINSLSVSEDTEKNRSGSPITPTEHFTPHCSGGVILV